MKAFKYALLGLIGVIGMLISMFGPVRIPFVESVAKSYYRYALGALLIVLLVITAILGLFVLAFDANNFKSEIKQFVKEHTQRELVIEGDIKVTFFPKLGLDTGKMALTQRNSAKVFASVDNARLYIAWWPLIKRQIVFDHVVINGIHANLIRLHDGSTNFEDLLISEEHLAPLTFDIDSVRVTDSSISWLDEMESQRFRLHDLQLETGRIADTAPSNLMASFNLSSEQPYVNSMIQLKSRLYFDWKAGRYEFADLEGKLEGGIGQFKQLSLDFGGTLDSYPNLGLFSLEDLVVSTSGIFDERSLSAKLNVPSLKLSNMVISGEHLVLDANMSSPNDSLSLALQMPRFEISNWIMKSSDLVADFNIASGDNYLSGNLNSPFIISMELTVPKLQLETFKLNITGNHSLLSSEVQSITTGMLVLDYGTQIAQLDFETRIDDSMISGKLNISDFNHPAYSSQISVSHFDFDKYLSSEWTKHLLDDMTIINTTSLKDMILDGSLTADDIKVNQIQVKSLSADINIGHSRIIISPLTANLFAGSLSGSISIDAQDSPEVSIKQKIQNISMDEMLSGSSFADKLEGKADIELEMVTKGNTMRSLQNALSGKVAVALTHGSLAGINLKSALIDGKSDLGTSNNERIISGNFNDRTEFIEFNANFNLKDGVGSCTSFDMKSPMISATGKGWVELESGNFDFLLNATVSSQVSRRKAGDLTDFRGVTVPLRVSGTHFSPVFAIDFASASGVIIPSLGAARVPKTADVTSAESSSAATVVQRKGRITGSSSKSKTSSPSIK